MREINLYNTLTRQKQKFIPNKPDQIDLYVCGVTVYDYCHIGHARTYIVFDMFSRYMQSLGYKINYIRNITDIDDKIIKRAQEVNISPEALATKYADIMHEDFKKLGLLPPQQEPKATEYINKMIDLISQLIQANKAYVVGGEVFFAVKSYAKYGELAKRNLDELATQSRIEADHKKRANLDFVLWKPAKPGEPAWESPWGLGRPGWHTECAAMALDCLGTSFDIHGGGYDLQFPHHENECAQASSITNKLFAKYWLHVGFLNLKQEKMSKSLGNILNIRDMLKNNHPEAFRLMVLTAHYRSQIEFDQEKLTQNNQALERLYRALQGLTPSTEHPDNEYVNKFHLAMADDLNTPEACAVLFELAREINNLKNQQNLTEASNFGGTLKNLANSLGLLFEEPEKFFQGDILDKTQIEHLIQERNVARANKHWQRADEIRQQLITMGIELEDNKNETRWHKV